MKKVLSVLLVAVLLVGTVFAGGQQQESGDQSLAKVRDAGRFVLGLDDSFPPMGYRDENNEIVGFDIDVAREVCERMGIELVCQPISWDAKEMELNSGNIDCIWNGFTVTPEREAALLFSEPYLKNNQIVVVRQDSAYNSLADLSGEAIGVQAGSSGSDALAASSFGQAVGSVVEYNNYLLALMDLNARGVEGVVIDSIVANAQMEASGGAFKAIPNASLAAEDYAIGFRKNDVALRNEIQNQINAMKEDGTLAAISLEWFGEDLTDF